MSWSYPYPELTPVGLELKGSFSTAIYTWSWYPRHTHVPSTYRMTPKLCQCALEMSPSINWTIYPQDQEAIFIKVLVNVSSEKRKQDTELPIGDREGFEKAKVKL